MIQNKLAGFKLRLLAGATDTQILLLPHALLWLLISSSATVSNLVYNALLYAALVFLPLLLFNWIFYNPLLVTRFGGNLGKLLTGLRVIGEEPQTSLSFKKNLFRHTIGYQFSWLLFGLGFLSIIKDPQKQGWHDKAVGSKVIVVSNLWLVSLVVFILLTIINGILIVNSIENFSSGPLPKEFSN